MYITIKDEELVKMGVDVEGVSAPGITFKPWVCPKCKVSRYADNEGMKIRIEGRRQVVCIDCSCEAEDAHYERVSKMDSAFPPPDIARLNQVMDLTKPGFVFRRRWYQFWKL